MRRSGSLSVCGDPTGTLSQRPLALGTNLGVDLVEPGLQRGLVGGGVDAIDEQMRREPDDAAVVVAPKEPVETLGRADAEELRGGVVNDAVERAGLSERCVDLVAD